MISKHKHSKEYDREINRQKKLYEHWTIMGKDYDHADCEYCIEFWKNYKTRMDKRRKIKRND